MPQFLPYFHLDIFVGSFCSNSPINDIIWLNDTP
jgi:hypothetical protein